MQTSSRNAAYWQRRQSECSRRFGLGALALQGPVSVDAAGTTIGTLDLETAAGVTEGAGDTLSIGTGGNLAIRSVLDVVLNQNNAVTGNLAAKVTVPATRSRSGTTAT